MPHLYLTDAEAEWLLNFVDLCAREEYTGIEGSEENGRAIYSRLREVWFDADPAPKCESCGVELSSPNPRKTTCSDACRQALTRANRARIKMIKAMVEEEMRIAALKAEESAQATATAKPLPSSQ